MTGPASWKEIQGSFSNKYKIFIENLDENIKISRNKISNYRFLLLYSNEAS